MAYYVSMFDKRSNIPGDGTYYRLLGPFAHKSTAISYVERVSEVSRSYDPRTVFCSFGVSNYPEYDVPSVLNSEYPEVLEAYRAGTLVHNSFGTSEENIRANEYEFYEDGSRADI